MKQAVERIKSKRILKWSFITVAVFIFLAGVVWGTNLTVNNMYREIFLPGTKVGGIDIGNLSYIEARQKLDKRIDFINRRGFVYIGPGKTVTIYPSVSAVDSTESLAWIVSWDIDQSLENVEADQAGKSLANLFNKLQTLLNGKDYSLDYNWDKEQHREILAGSFLDALAEKQEASFEFKDQNLEIVPEQVGQTIDYDQALEDTVELVETLASTDIELKVIKDVPEIKVATVDNFKDQIINTANRGDFYLTYNEKDWNVPNTIWRNWLKLVETERGEFDLVIDETKLDEYLTESSIRDEVEQPVQDAKFDLEDGRVSTFVSSQPGQAINLEESLAIINQTLKNSGELEASLVVEVVEPKVDNQDVNDLGIVEIIGTGESDFSGSPVNRVHNINVGANTLHGVLIAPDEEFSLMTTLGEIDGESGYRQELVIKGDKTIPEYGGGLCQIGTTMFRGALSSGLPITERRNHSYRVSYYEPAGTDATIYNPWPDLKFKNDTGKHILIQSRIEGTKIYFDFWGTEDGRIAITTEPVIYNIVAPPEKKIIKTTEIPVGTEKCTERAHAGADAKFDYSVQYPDQPDPVEETFYSHYVPWQEVCLLGVTEEELAAEQENDNATSTPEE